MSFLTKGQSRPASFRRYIDNPGSAREKTTKRNGGQRRTLPVVRVPRNSLFSRDSQLLFEPRATGLSPRPARHEEGVRRAVNYSPAAPTCSASPRMLPRGSPPASQERDDVAREIMLLPLVGHGLAPPRPPADVQWRACFGSTSRTIRPSCRRPGGCPLPRVQFLEPQRGSYVSPALPSSRARGLEYMRALLQSMRMLRMYYRSCASCKIFCAAIPYPRLEVLKLN